MSSKKETEEERMIREAQQMLAKLAPEVSALEKKTEALKKHFEQASEKMVQLERNEPSF